jgi:hypothetical protein
MLTRILISLAALAAAIVTVASAAHVTGVNAPQPVYSANNGGDGGP